MTTDTEMKLGLMVADLYNAGNRLAFCVRRGDPHDIAVALEMWDGVMAGGSVAITEAGFVLVPAKT